MITARRGGEQIHSAMHHAHRQRRHSLWRHPTTLLAGLLLTSVCPAQSQDAPERSSVASPPSPHRLPVVTDGTSTLFFHGIQAGVYIPDNTTLPISRTLSLTGEFSWTPDADDFYCADAFVIHEATDGNGRSLLDAWNPQPGGARDRVSWHVGPGRDEPPFPERHYPFAEFHTLKAIPQTIAKLSGEFARWRVTDVQTHIIPVKITRTPTDLAPDWTAEIFTETDPVGEVFVVLRIAYWGEQTEAAPGELNAPTLPALLGPSVNDHLGADGKADPKLRWYPTRPTPAEIQDFADKGAIVWRWGFQRSDGQFPADNALRVRIVQQVEYDPIPFLIEDIDLIGQLLGAADVQESTLVAQQGDTVHNLASILRMARDTADPTAKREHGRSLP